MLFITICIIGFIACVVFMLPRILKSFADKKDQARKEADDILSNAVCESVEKINTTIDKLQEITTFNVHEPIPEEDKIRINKLREIRDSIEVTST